MKIAFFWIWVIVWLVLTGFLLGAWIFTVTEVLTLERAHREWKAEANARNDVCEAALRVLTDSKWKAYELKTDQLRKQRNKEDGRK